MKRDWANVPGSIRAWLRILGYFAMVLCASQVFGDTVKLKNGKTLENVKSKVEKDSILVKYENGKSETVPKSGVLSIKVSAVDWKKKEVAPLPPNLDEKAQEEARKLAEQEAQKEAEEERLRVAEASKFGSDWTPRPEEEQINPWGNFALGFVPGYSGLYRTKNNWGGGVFTFLESVALLGVIDAYSAKRLPGTPFSGDYAPFGLIGLSASTQPGFTGVFGNLVLINGFSQYGYEGGLTGQSIAEVGPGATAESLLKKDQTSRAGVLGLLLLVDGIASYFSASAWNEGTYEGEKDPNYVRPTRPGARTIRSAFFPGWGQVYGGNNIKGYTWMVGAVGLLANAASKETAVTEATRDLKKSGFSTITPVFVSGGLLPSIGSNQGESAGLWAFLLTTPTYQALESAVQERNQAWSIFGGFWFLNLVDAYFFSGKKEGAPVSFTPQFQLQPVGIIGGRAQLESFTSLTVEYKYE